MLHIVSQSTFGEGTYAQAFVQRRDASVDVEPAESSPGKEASSRPGQQKQDGADKGLLLH
jgi:hypothetical protein